MNFKPSFWKVIVTLLLMAILYVALAVYNINTCAEESEISCPGGCNLDFKLIPSCCTCSSINENLTDLAMLLGPGLLFFIVWSFFQSRSSGSDETEYEKKLKREAEFE